MKTIKLLSITCDAISGCLRVADLVQSNHPDDAKTADLTCDESLGLSNTMTVVRDLIREYPAQIRNDDIDKTISDFYIHLFADATGTHNLRAIAQMGHVIHTFVYDKYSTAQDAVSLYS